MHSNTSKTQFTIDFSIGGSFVSSFNLIPQGSVVPKNVNQHYWNIISKQTKESWKNKN